MFSAHRHPWIGIATLLVVLSVRPSNADDLFAVATELYQASQWQQAAAAFIRLAHDSGQDESTRLTAQLYTGESLVQLGQYAEARQHFQSVQQHPLTQQQAASARMGAQAHFRLGEAAWLLGDAEQAAQLLQTYLERYPLGSSASHAQTYLATMSERKSAEASFAGLDEAVGLERDGRHDAALAAYHELLAQQQHPALRAETLRRTARLHDHLAQSREALSFYRQFLAEYPDSQRTAEVLLAVAWLHDRLDQSAQAADTCRLVHAKFPQSSQAADAAYWLALANADKRSTENVSSEQIESSAAEPYIDWLLAQASLSIERTPLWEQALCLKCQLIAAQGQWQQIEDLIGSVEGRLRVGPLKTKLEFWAAEATFRLRRYDAARAKFAVLQPKTIGISEPWTAMVPLRRAQLAARRQQWSQVLERLDQLEQDFPDFELDYEVDYLRGRALAGRGEMTAARKFYSRVADNPAAAGSEAATMAGWMIGETFFHQRDYPRARQAYEIVMQQTAFKQWQSRAALQAGKCWELEHRWDEAASLYLMALERWPNSSSDPVLESRLRWAQVHTTSNQAQPSQTSQRQPSPTETTQKR